MKAITLALSLGALTAAVGCNRNDTAPTPTPPVRTGGQIPSQTPSMVPEQQGGPDTRDSMGVLKDIRDRREDTGALPAPRADPGEPVGGGAEPHNRIGGTSLDPDGTKADQVK